MCYALNRSCKCRYPGVNGKHEINGEKDKLLAAITIIVGKWNRYRTISQSKETKKTRQVIQRGLR